MKLSLYNSLTALYKSLKIERLARDLGPFTPAEAFYGGVTVSTGVKTRGMHAEHH